MVGAFAFGASCNVWMGGRKKGSFAVLLLMCMENIIVLFEVHWHDKLVCA